MRASARRGGGGRYRRVPGHGPGRGLQPVGPRQLCKPAPCTRSCRFHLHRPAPCTAAPCTARPRAHAHVRRAAGTRGGFGARNRVSSRAGSASPLALLLFDMTEACSPPPPLSFRPSVPLSLSLPLPLSLLLSLPLPLPLFLSLSFSPSLSLLLSPSFFCLCRSLLLRFAARERISMHQRTSILQAPSHRGYTRLVHPLNECTRTHTPGGEGGQDRQGCRRVT
jgi:hypothetical protein